MNLLNADKFRFTSKGHKHEAFLDEKWQEIMGCSTIAGGFDDKSWMGWWASGQALRHMGWTNPKKDEAGNQILRGEGRSIRLKECIETAIPFHEMIKGLSREDYWKLLDTSYHKHSQETKDTAEWGTKLHSILEQVVKKGILGAIELDEANELDPYVEQLKAFFQWAIKNEVQWLASELQVGSLLWRYAGIFDYVCKIDGKIVLGDFKTSNIFKPTWIPQLVGLKVALEEMGQKVDQIAVTRLSRDGEFEHRVIECDYETEMMAFIKAKNFLEERNKWKARWKE